MKKNNKVFFAIVVCFLMFGSSIYVANSFVLQSTSDVLIVQVGSDDTIEESTNIILKNLQQRNKDITLEAGEDKDSTLQTNEIDTVYGTSDICLGQLGSLTKGSILLDVDVIKVDISDLKNDVLDKYHTKVLIVVGHGSNEGLEDNDDKIKWDNVKEIISDNSAQFTILATCYSANAAKDLPNAFGFPNIIDAILAAYIASALIFKMLGEVSLTNNVMELAQDRYLEIQENPELIKPLGLDFGEIVYWITVVIYSILAIILNFYIDPNTSFLRTAAINLAYSGSFQILNALMFLAIGTISIWDFIGTCFAFICDAIGALISAICAIFSWNFWYALFLWIYFGATLAVFIAQIACSGPTPLALKVIPAVVTFIGIGWGIYQDFID